MGLDVGVVKIDYSYHPRGVVKDFLLDFAIFPEHVPEHDTWGGGWEANSIFEWSKRRIIRKANRYAKEHNLSEESSKEILDWIRNLPWEGGTIMLHLS
jgi:hypothetical protein